MFKIHVGECSGTRSDVNANSAFMFVCVCQRSGMQRKSHGQPQFAEKHVGVLNV